MQENRRPPGTPPPRIASTDNNEGGYAAVSNGEFTRNSKGLVMAIPILVWNSSLNDGQSWTVLLGPRESPGCTHGIRRGGRSPVAAAAS